MTFFIDFTCTNGSKPNEQLLYASQEGFQNWVEQISECSMTDINTYDDEGRTPLYLAALRNHSNIINFLLHQDSIDVNLGTQNDGETALLVAAMFGYSDIVQLLLDNKKTDVNKGSPDTGLTPLIIASRNGHESTVEVLLQHPALLVNSGLFTTGVNSLIAAIKNGHNTVAGLLLRHSRIDVNQGTKNGESPLIVASSNSNSSLCVELLLAKPRIDVNKAVFEGQTALFFAVEFRNYDTVELLLRCPKVDTRLFDHEYKTAQDYANEYNLTKIINAFEMRGSLTTEKGHSCCSDNINRGLVMAAEAGDVTWIKTFLICPQISINLGNQEGFTSLIMAARKGYTEIVELLLRDHRIDTNKYNSVNGKTALIVASEEGKWKVVELLLSNPQIDLEISDIEGNTALNKAATNGRFTTVKLLLRCTKTKVNNIESKDKDINEAIKLRAILLKSGHTCCLNVADGLLQAATKGYHLEIRGLLLCPDSNSNVVDRKGRTPLYLASWKGHYMAVQELLEDPTLDTSLGINIGGGTAFSIASEKGHDRVLQLLVTHINNKDFTALNIGWCEQNWTPHIITCTKATDDEMNKSTTDLTSPATGE